jgi:integrase
VGDALDDYLARMASDGKKSVSDARFRADRHIRPDLGDVEVSRLTTDRIRRWLDALASRPAMLRAKAGKENPYREETVEGETARKRRASANRSLTTLKAALNHAWGEGKVSTDAAWRRVKPYKKVDEARVQYLSEDEITRLVNAADPALRELIRGALYTGARYGELTRLKAGDFHAYKHYDADLKRYVAVGTVTIADSKSGKPRHVALTDDARAYFERATAGLKGDDLIFRRADGEPWAKSHQQRPLKAACAAARIEPAASFHILRHTYASHLAMAGVPFPVIAANLGHADTRMVSKHYAHLAPDYVSATIRAAGLGYTLPADDRANVETLRVGAAD